MTRFAALVMSLPARNKTVRMRVWRALTAMGCGVLRDGVYLLPADSSAAENLLDIEREVAAAGGFAMTVEIDPRTSTQLERVRKLFDRTAEYSGLVRDIERTRRAAGTGRVAGGVATLRRRFAQISATDFFPGQANLQAGAALTALEAEIERLRSGSEPRVAGRAVRKVDPARYRNRIWASRSHPWVDRLASAWLIKRSIDPQARFLWLDRPSTRPKTSVGFDFDGAEFTHTGQRVTFEVLLAAFDLEADPVLRRLGLSIHYLDAGGVPGPEAAGIEIVLRGARERARSDDELVLEATRVFDLVHAGLTRMEEQP